MSAPRSIQDSPLLLFGLRLRDIRVQFGFSLERCAALLDISPSHLCNLERGRKEPSFGLLIAIATSLNISLDYLVLGLPDRMHDAALIFRSDDELLRTMLLPAGDDEPAPESP